MRIRRLAAAIEVWTPAKLNLHLEIFHKRNDGFHELETLMCPIRVYDTLVFRAGAARAEQVANPIGFDCRWASGLQPSTCPALPQDSRNTALRAVELLRTKAGVEATASLQLIKRIPVFAGLGGGSSDAAAALLAANLAWGLQWSQSKLMALAAEIGSDVPFFLADGWAMCRGRGEIIEPLAGMPRLSCVVVHPGVGLSTAEVYARCQPADSEGESSGKSPRERNSVSDPIASDPLMEALRSGQLGQIAQRLHNRLQPAAEQLSPVVERLAADFAKAGVLGHQMSGSGSSYFGLCRNDRDARRVAALLRHRGWASVFSTATGI